MRFGFGPDLLTVMLVRGSDLRARIRLAAPVDSATLQLGELCLAGTVTDRGGAVEFVAPSTLLGGIAHGAVSRVTAVIGDRRVVLAVGQVARR